MSKNLDKLKQFFRSNKTNSSQERVYVLNSEIERELRKESSNEKRVKFVTDLGDIVLTNRLEEVFKNFYFIKHVITDTFPQTSMQYRSYGR